MKINLLIRKIFKQTPILESGLEKYDNMRLRQLAKQDPRLVANRIYKEVFHKNINWEHPTNLIEKIYWLQLFTDTTLWTLCADKYSVRQYVEQKGCAELLNQLYGHWLKPDEIDYDKLPDSFVLKTTNGCGQVLLIHDKHKMDKEAVNRQLSKWLRLKYGYADAQIHYSRITPSIIAEKLLTDASSSCDKSLTDYKLWSFHGQVEYILVVYDRTKQGYKLSAYDLQWNNISSQALKKDNPHFCGESIAKPKSLEHMIAYAQKLSASFAEVRVDFYEIDGNPVLGELTFTAGYGSHTEEFYEFLGSKIHLESVKRIKGMNRPSLS